MECLRVVFVARQQKGRGVPRRRTAAVALYGPIREDGDPGEGTWRQPDTFSPAIRDCPLRYSSEDGGRKLDPHYWPEAGTPP